MQKNLLKIFQNIMKLLFLQLRSKDMQIKLLIKLI